MRWSAYTATCAPTDQAQLVNALTVGWGYANLAARLAGSDRATAVILSHLAQAAAHLAGARARLSLPGDQLPAAAAASEPEESPAGHTSWRDFLRTLPADDATELERSLAAAVVAARQAAAVATCDGGVEAAQYELDRAQAGLARVRQLCRPRRSANGPSASARQRG
jgi:hypothetical protein